MCKSGDILAADGGEEELPTNLSALVYSLLQESALFQAKDLKLSINGTDIETKQWRQSHILICWSFFAKLEVTFFFLLPASYVLPLGSF